MCASALYPGQNPPSGNSVAGIPVLVEAGWPDPASLDKMVADFQASNPRAQFTIYPRTTEKNTTRYSRQWAQTGDPQAKTFTLTGSGQVITVGGAQPSTFYGQNFAVFVSGKAYVYRSLQSDNPTSIAAALAALIVVDIPGTTSTGPAITVPSPARIGTLRVGTQAPISQEVKRQEREFQLTGWAPSPALRNLVASPIDIVVGQTPFLTFADGSKGRLLYKGSPFTDFDQKQGVFRRDLIVTVEYPTLASDMAPQAIAAEIDFFLSSSTVYLNTESGQGIITEGGTKLVAANPTISTFS
jgi:hypothetical protein